MKVISEGDLKELILTGYNRKYRDVAQNPALIKGLQRVLEVMMSVESVADLNKFSFLHYEQLKYEYNGLSSVRLSNRFVHRLIFEEQNDKISLKLIEINDTHYGNKKG